MAPSSQRVNTTDASRVEVNLLIARAEDDGPGIGIGDGGSLGEDLSSSDRPG